jgi:hypothetical protein
MRASDPPAPIQALGARSVHLPKYAGSGQGSDPSARNLLTVNALRLVDHRFLHGHHIAVALIRREQRVGSLRSDLRAANDKTYHLIRYLRRCNVRFWHTSGPSTSRAGSDP